MKTFPTAALPYLSQAGFIPNPNPEGPPFVRTLDERYVMEAQPGDLVRQVYLSVSRLSSDPEATDKVIAVGQCYWGNLKKMAGLYRVPTT